MIDYLKLRFTINHTPVGSKGFVVVDQSTGEVLTTKYKQEFVEGSYSSKVLVHSLKVVGDVGRELEVKGCPAKFLQGHNITGSNDLPAVAEAFLMGVLDAVGIQLTEDDRSAIRRGIYKVDAVHVTENYEAPTPEAVFAYIQKLGEANASKWQVCQYGQETRYFDRDSKRRSIKVYAKGPEVVKHPFPADLPHRTELIEYAQRLVRVELELKERELYTQGLKNGYAWKPGTASDLFQKYTSKLTAPKNVRLEATAIASLPDAYFRTYTMWANGMNLVTAITCRNKRSRHRRYFLAHHGIDILSPPGESNQTLPAWEVVTVKPAQMPALTQSEPRQAA